MMKHIDERQKRPNFAIYDLEIPFYIIIDFKGGGKKGWVILKTRFYVTFDFEQ